MGRFSISQNAKRWPRAMDRVIGVPPNAFVLERAIADCGCANRCHLRTLLPDVKAGDDQRL
jgi:hypothetical protein